MGKDTKIEWARHTFNPWIGCAPVSPACDHCYARAMMDDRYGRARWGVGEDRVKTSAANWAEPKRWDRAAAAAGEIHTVFCLSLGDIWDNEVDPVWRRQLFTLIEATPNLLWLLLSKRIGNAVKMCDPKQGNRPLPRNAALGATIANQPEANRDVPKLLRAGATLGARFTFVSLEPMLGPIDLYPWLDKNPTHGRFNCAGDAYVMPPSLDWVITGGETGPHARGTPRTWFLSFDEQCAATGVPHFHKRNGEWIDADEWLDSLRPAVLFEPDFKTPWSPPRPLNYANAEILAKASNATFEHQSDGSTLLRVGKPRAGRLLNGVERNAFPFNLAGGTAGSSRSLKP